MTERFKMAAVVPVVVLDEAKDAVATAKALLAGGVDVEDYMQKFVEQHPDSVTYFRTV